jgi:hypothetical protein
VRYRPKELQLEIDVRSQERKAPSTSRRLASGRCRDAAMRIRAELIRAVAYLSLSPPTTRCRARPRTSARRCCPRPRRSRAGP